MGSVFPYLLDSFPTPNSGSKLNEIPHAELHLSESAAIMALQGRVGITGSTITTTIDFELHDINHGHDHDGINSRPVAIGPDESGYYTGSLAYDQGYFTDFSSSFRVGSTIDRFNRLFKSLNLTLSGVVSGSGVDYRQIVFLSENGPFEHFGTGSFHEFTYNAKAFVSTSIWYTDASKSQKIIEKSFIRNSKQQATNVYYKVYEIDGISIKTTVEDIITYAGAVEATRTRLVY